MKRRQSINHLPEELIWEILISNLPVKSLVRFKSVSKSWRSLISSPKFVQDHLNRSRPDHTLMGTFYSTQTYLTIESCSLNSPSLDQNDAVPTWRSHPYPISTENTDVSPISFEGSCNGLILVRVIRQGRLYLWNPSTRRVKAIPPPSSYAKLGRSGPFIYGFGYDGIIDDYKVVWGISRSKRCYKKINKTKIYIVRTGYWKDIDSPEISFALVYNSGIFVNGKLHWLGFEESSLKITSLALEEGKENYQILAKPEHLSTYFRPYNIRLENFGGYLSLIVDIDMKDISVWVMMKYGVVKSWTKVWTLSDFDDRMHSITWAAWAAQPFWVTRNGDIFVSFGKQKVVVYNGKNKLREYRIGKDGGTKSIFPHIVYVESLVST